MKEESEGGGGVREEKSPPQRKVLSPRRSGRALRGRKDWSAMSGYNHEPGEDLSISGPVCSLRGHQGQRQVLANPSFLTHPWPPPQSPINTAQP